MSEQNAVADLLSPTPGSKVSIDYAHVCIMVGHDDDIVLDPRLFASRPRNSKSRWEGKQSDMAIAESMLAQFPHLRVTYARTNEELLATDAPVRPAAGCHVQPAHALALAADARPLELVRSCSYSRTSPKSRTAGTRTSSRRSRRSRPEVSLCTRRPASRSSYRPRLRTCSCCRTRVRHAITALAPGLIDLLLTRLGLALSMDRAAGLPDAGCPSQ